MYYKALEVFKLFKSTPRDRFYFKNISNSIITVINRESFEITNDWFQSLLKVSYNEEVTCKYVPELHETNNFERQHLNDILDFKGWKSGYINQIVRCETKIVNFRNNYRHFFQALDSEGTRKSAKNALITSTILLEGKLNILEYELGSLKTAMNEDGYRI